MALRFYLSRLINLPRVTWFNLRVFGIKGLIMPVYIPYNMAVKEIHRGSIVIQSPLRRFMIEIGEGGSEGYPSRRGSLLISKRAQLVFEGKACFAQGTVIRIDQSGKMYVGDNFIANKNCTFWCSHSIKVGENSLFGFDVFVRDDDGHTICNEDGTKQQSKPISIGRHVWVAAKASILKGAKIADDCVVGYNSCVFLHSIAQTL